MPKMPKTTTEEGRPTEKKIIATQSFDLYSKEIGEIQGSDRIITFDYDITISPANSTMLKSLLCQIYNGNILDLKFIPYVLDKQY